MFPQPIVPQLSHVQMLRPRNQRTTPRAPTGLHRISHRKRTVRRQPNRTLDRIVQRQPSRTLGRSPTGMSPLSGLKLLLRVSVRSPSALLLRKRRVRRKNNSARSPRRRSRKRRNKRMKSRSGMRSRLSSRRWDSALGTLNFQGALFSSRRRCTAHPLHSTIAEGRALQRLEV